MLTGSDDDPDLPRSRHHVLYIALETVKVLVLATLGTTSLAAIA